MTLFHRGSTYSSARSSMDDPDIQTHRTSLFGHRGWHSNGSGHSSASSTGRRGYSHSGRHEHEHGLFRSKNNEDPSITAARDRVFHAEEAERAADKALYASRLAVQDARNDVRELERDAKEAARLAKFKQKEAKDISKRAKPLGRHH